jgi:hypothetical protein
MKGPCVTTRAERGVLESARLLLGGNLSEFLLFGHLGEPRRRSRLLLDAHLWDARRRTPAYRLEIVSSGEEGLPGRRDPLVLVAVLHLLLTGDAGRDGVTFAGGEVPALLGWEDTPAARREVEAALSRYCSTSFHLASRERRGPGRVVVRRRRAQQLISEYETSTERAEEGLGMSRSSTTVRFHRGFLAGVSGEEKYFLGVDFELLLLEHVNAEHSEQA